MGRGKKTKADLALFCKDLKGRQLNRRASEENSKYIIQNNLIHLHLYQNGLTINILLVISSNNPP